MRTDILSFITASENRKAIFKAIAEHPKRQWSCSSLEEFTKTSHATVFRALRGLKNFGILKTTKINKKDIIYELVQSSLTSEIERILNIEIIAAKGALKEFIDSVKDKIDAAILYGSFVKRVIKPESDIDVLLIVKNHHNDKEIFDKAATISFKNNRVISPVILKKKEIYSKANRLFINSIKENMEILHGEAPF